MLVDGVVGGGDREFLDEGEVMLMGGVLVVGVVIGNILMNFQN